MRKIVRFVCFLLAAGAALPGASYVQRASASEASDPIGRWLTANGHGVVEIDRCGGRALCGRIVGLRPDDPNDLPPTDVHGRPQCGLTIITDAVPSGRSEWTGRITNPQNGRIYGAQLSVETSGRLRLRGYLGLPIFGQTVIWQPFAGQIADQCRIVG
jgi:uncharacterized protein (DUF2147 family)